MNAKAKTLLVQNQLRNGLDIARNPNSCVLKAICKGQPKTNSSEMIEK